MKLLTNEEFITKAIKLYGNKYNFSKTIYTNSRTKLIIICPIHGEFEISPSNFLNGHECPGCTKGNSIIDFIKKSNAVHLGKYDYSKVIYINSRTKVTITCPIHGDFEQTPANHIAGTGCPLCASYGGSKGGSKGGRKAENTDNFIIKSIEVHGNKYDYSKVSYINNRTKVDIICPIHGLFQQTPCSHLQGCGCPKCKSSHLEKEVREILVNNLINFEEQKTWDWLVYKSNQFVDFYLPELELAIECQGIQHFRPINFFGGVEGFIDTKERDKNKFNLCLNRNINILYYSNLKEDYDYPLLNTNNLMNEIKKFSVTN